MKTFKEPGEFVQNPHFHEQRKKKLSGLIESVIDAPIIKLIMNFNRLPCCFTEQSCYGHFICAGRSDPHNLEPLPVTDSIFSVEYRIAYICFCIEDSDSGKNLLHELKGITSIDPENVQFGCAEWFWERQVNTFVLQVEPDRFKYKDKATLDYKEALLIEKKRNEFFIRLEELLQNQL